MKNMKGFAPTAATREVRGIGDVFREEPARNRLCLRPRIRG